VKAFSYQVYVSNVSGSDSTGSGQIGNPYQTITYALSQLPSAQTIPVIINLACGTYPENVVVSRDNVYLVGGSTSLSTATGIVGSITWDATGSAQSVIIGGISSLQFNNLIYNNANAFDQSLIITDCLITSASGVSAIKCNDTSAGAGNGSLIVQNSSVYFIDTIAVDIGGTVSVNMINSSITNFPGTTAGVQLVRTTVQGRISLFGCSLIQNNATSTVLPLVDITNSTTTGNGMTINSSILQYTSATSDAGTGAKCCIRFNNTAVIGTSSSNPGMNCIYNNMRCEGATTTNGSAGQFVVVQKGSIPQNVYFNYGGNYCGATANHLSNSANLVKTAWVVLAP
jgi:hypothetical protein